jgi:Luciferase-like monooxygenase
LIRGRPPAGVDPLTGPPLETGMERTKDRTAPEHTGSFGTQSGLWLPLFDELADPVAVARVAAEAEEAGWHGVFVWDQLRWPRPVRQVTDPWISLAAIATEQVRLGPMVTPLPRRRPAKVARETATLDGLSGGRLTLGVGIGSDRFAGELSKTGEELDDRLRGRMLDDSLQILRAAWSGEPVHHRGEHYTIDGVQFLPRPVQRPGVPVWIAGFPGNVKPLRGDTTAPYDIVVGLAVGVDPAPFASAGATWWHPEFAPDSVSLDAVRGVLGDGPMAPRS